MRLYLEELLFSVHLLFGTTSWRNMRSDMNSSCRDEEDMLWRYDFLTFS
jgi:hypothetical protein